MLYEKDQIVMKDIINVPAFRCAIDRALEGAPPGLLDRWPGIGAYLRRAAESHGSVRRARGRNSDPAWARAKFDEGRPLHRFHEQDRGELIEDICKQLDELSQVARLAGELNGPCAQEAAAFLRGLTHRWPSLSELRHEVAALLERERSIALRARMDETVRSPSEIRAGRLTGTCCQSVRQIVDLGREARNCLAVNERYWEGFVSGGLDIWSLRSGSRLVTVLKVKRDKGCVVEAEGPGNQPVGLHDARDVALFCQAAGLAIGRNCNGLLADYAAQFLVEPRVVPLGREVAVYAEWPTAVRIDLSGGVELSEDWDGRSRRMLTLAFDPACPLVAAVLHGPDPRDAVEAFGRKALRRIVQSVAMEQAVPSLVQHRLLALAA